jgi:hypothetical protein
VRCATDGAHVVVTEHACPDPEVDEWLVRVIGDEQRSVPCVWLERAWRCANNTFELACPQPPPGVTPDPCPPDHLSHCWVRAAGADDAMAASGGGSSTSTVVLGVAVGVVVLTFVIVAVRYAAYMSRRAHGATRHSPAMHKKRDSYGAIDATPSGIGYFSHHGALPTSVASTMRRSTSPMVDIVVHDVHSHRVREQRNIIDARFVQGSLN